MNISRLFLSRKMAVSYKLLSSLYYDFLDIKLKTIKLHKLASFKDSQMKKILFIPIILMIFSCSTPRTAVTKIGKEDIGNLIGGSKEGKWKFYEDGRLSSSGNYSKNQQTGYWNYFYPNGKIHRKGKYINDKQNGFWYYYFDNGKLMGKGNIINNEEDGLWKWFYNNGNIYTERFYDNGKLLEIRSCFDKFGRRLDCGRIIDGNGIMILHDLENKADTIRRFEFEKGILKTSS
jgi:hypothetical protein